MASIDKKIVEMQLDNKNFESNAKNTLSTVERMKKVMDFGKVGESLSGVGKAASGIDMSSISSAAETVTGRLSALGIVGVTALMNITNSAIDAGAQLLKSLTVTPIAQGFAEYELKMGSIQTIMASTGAPLDAVNEKLEELNLYADKTIYSFSDMTSNIGKFTNAGVGLDDAVAAIQGVSNVAAVSGANANEASRGMYNFAQALSAGHIKLIDWKSIENANMATVEFKTQLMESAVAAGTLERGVDGMYNVLSTNSKGGTMKTAISATQNFNESLEYQWMTTDALVGTLGDYADETTEIGKKAFAAAQDVKTFTQLIDTLQEAVGSGWGATFELLVGDFEEAKSLFTDMSDAFGGAIGRSADARNEMLKGWKDLGGRTVLIEAVGTLFNNLTHIISAVTEGFREIFPKQTAEGLYALTKGFSDLMDKLWLNDMALEAIYNTSKGFFTVIKVGVDIIKAFIGGFFKLLGALMPVVGGFLNITGAIGEFISSGGEAISITEIIVEAFELLRKGITKVTTWVGDAFSDMGEKINKWTSFIKKDTGDMSETIGQDSDSIVEKMSPISKAFEAIKTTISNMWSFVKPILSSFKEAIFDTFSKVKEVVGGLFAGFTTEDAANVLNLSVLTGIAIGIGKFFKNLSGPVGGLSDLLSGITGVLDGVRGSFETWQTNLKSKTLMSIAVAIGILAVALVLLSKLDAGQVVTALGAIVGAMTVLVGSLTILTKLSSSGKISRMNGIAFSLILLSTALVIMAKALKMLGDLSWKQIVKGLGALTGLLGGLVVASRLMEKDSKGMITTAAALVIFAVAVRTLGKAIGALGSMDVKTLTKGFIAVSILVAEMVIVSKTMGSTKGMMSSAVTLISMATAINILGNAVTTLGKLSIKELAKGLVAVTGAIAVMVAAVNLLPKDTLLRSAGLISVALALGVLAGVVVLYSKMSLAQLAKGLGALTGSIVALLIGLNLAKGSGLAAASLILVATAINMLIPAIVIMSNLPITKLVTGLGALAAIFVIIGVSAKLLMPVVPAMLALAGAVALFGVGIFAIGSGIALLGVGITTLGASIGILGTMITVAVTTVAGLLPVIVTAAVGAIGIFIASIANMFVSVAETLVKTFTNIVGLVTTYAPVIITGVLTMLSTLLTSFAENLPQFLTAGASLIQAFLNGVATTLPGIVVAAISVVTSFLNALISELPTLMNVGVNFLVAIMEGITVGLPALIEGAVALVVSFVETLTEQIPLIVTTAVDFIVAMAETLIDNLPRIVETAVEIIVTFVAALGAQLPVIIDAAFKLIIDFVNGLADAIRDNTGDLLAAGVNLVAALVEGIVDGVFKMLPIVWDSAKDIIGKVAAAIKDGFTWLKDNGWDIIKNVVNGVLGAVGKLATSVWNGAKDIVGNVLGAIKDGLTGLWDAGWDIAKNVVDGILGGIGKLGKSVWDGAKNLGSKMLGGIGNFLGIASPSKEMFKIGAWSGEGVVNGLASMGKSVVKGATSLGKKVLDPVNAAMTSLVDSIERDVDYQPVITPVINTTEMDKGLKGIKGAMTKAFDTTIGNVSVLTGASRPTRDTTKPNGQNGSTKGQDNSVTNNNFTLGGTYYIKEESDIHKVAKELHNLTKKKARA